MDIYNIHYKNVIHYRNELPVTIFVFQKINKANKHIIFIKYYVKGNDKFLLLKEISSCTQLYTVINNFYLESSNEM